MSFPVKIVYANIPPVEDVSEQAVAIARTFLRSLPGRRNYNFEIDEQTLIELANIFSIPGDRFLERFATHVAYLARNTLERDEIAFVFSQEGIYTDSIDLHTFLLIPRPFPELKLYHLPVAGGQVSVKGRERELAASFIYFRLLERLPVKTSLPNSIFSSLLPQTRKKTGGKGTGFLKLLESASGIPDGRKRILFFWLIPYWVNVLNLSEDEAVERAKDWVERQGAKIYESWLRSEARNAKKKGIRPWSLKKVQTVSPDLIKILQEVGILE